MDHQVKVGADADRPIEEPGADALNRKGFVNRVALTLTRVSDDQPLVVALEGPWGSGKTSILNLVEHELKEQSDVAVVRYNPWYFRGEQELLVGLFSALTRAIGASDVPARLEAAKALNKYMVVLTAAASVAPLIVADPSPTNPSTWAMFAAPLAQAVSRLIGAKPAVEALRQEPTVEERRKQVGDKLRESGIRVIVLVDDIDRLYPDDVRTVFKLVRLVADLPKVSYLLAFDREEVCVCLDAIGDTVRDCEHGESYLQKIVQVSIPLPKIRESDIRRIAFLGLDSIIERHGLSVTEKEARRLAIAWPQFFEQQPRTIRQVKRAVNAADFAVGLLSEEVNPVDVILFECFRIVYPQLVEAIREEPHCVLRIRSGRPERTNDLDTRLARELAALGERERKGIEDFLSELFPRYRTAHSDGFEIQWRKERRICSEEHLLKILDYGVPSGVISERAYSQLIQAASSIEADDGSRLALSLGSIVRQAGWSDLIWRLRQDQGDLPHEAALALAMGVAESSGGLRKNDGIMGILSSSQNGALFVSQVVRRLPEPQRAGAAKTIVEKSGKLIFAARVVEWIVGLLKADDCPEEWNSVAEAARSAFGKRANVELVGPAVLHEESDDVLHLLFRWKDAIGDEPFAAKIQMWFSDDRTAAAHLCSHAIRYVAPEDFDTPMHSIPASTGYQALAELLDPSLLAEALGYDPNEPLTDDDERAAASLPHVEQARTLFLISYQHRKIIEGGPDDLMAAVIDAVCDRYLRVHAATTGLELRRTLRLGEREAIASAIERCVPKWIGRGNLPPNDDYRPTLEGLLSSSRGSEVASCVESVLGELLDGLEREGADYRIRSERLAQVTGFDVPFLAGVLHVARLSGGGSSSGKPPDRFEYSLPGDIEEALECSTVDELLQLRASQGR